MLRYFRSVNSLATWKAGKEKTSVLSNYAKGYKSDLMTGRGFPSIWLPKNDEDLDKIALGILLKKGHLDNINLVGFDEACFNGMSIGLIQQKNDLNFPVPSVCHLHYEISTLDEGVLESIIERFMECCGDCEQIFKANPNTKNMRQVAARYLNDVTESYREKAREWGQKYLETC